MSGQWTSLLPIGFCGNGTEIVMKSRILNLKNFVDSESGIGISRPNNQQKQRRSVGAPLYFIGRKQA